MTRRRSVVAATLLAAVAFPAVAEARIIDLRLSANAGGMFGWGTTANTQDMFRQAAGPGVGFEAGFTLLILDASVNVLQIVNGSGFSATLIQGMLGTDIAIPAGHAKLENGQPVHVVRTGAEAGFVLGTNAPASLPVTNDQLADKGFTSRFRVAYEYFLNPFMSVGASGDFGYHYLLGGQAEINGQDHSSGYHLMGLGSFTFHLGY